jgi:hypothetical protein
MEARAYLPCEIRQVLKGDIFSMCKTEQLYQIIALLSTIGLKIEF